MNSLKYLITWWVLLLAKSAFAQSSPLAQFEGFHLPKSPARFALVVWAENYKPHTPVKNASNDGKRIAWVFHELGFDFVREIQDVNTPSKLYDALTEMKAHIAASQQPVVVVFFYAGHGFQLDGENYLVPTLAPDSSTADLVKGSVRLTEVGRRLQPERKASRVLFFIDACRTVKYLEDGTQKEESLMENLRPGFQGGSFLAPAFVSMAAAPGRAARSVSRYEPKLNSPYTAAMASLLTASLQTEEGFSLADLMEEIKRKVGQDTDLAQEPSEFNSDTVKTFYLVPRQKQLDEDKRHWQNVLANLTNKGCAVDYFLMHPTGQFALQAEYLLSLPGNPGSYCSVKEVKKEE
jgi:hypothetical protein